ncbi:nucleotide exchange factor GrpE [Halobellus sp. Atlit-31R]|nr:nucleotide exchange factor GrpE [Halobellus sp. Atlit-31R]
MSEEAPDGRAAASDTEVADAEAENGVADADAAADGVADSEATDATPGAEIPDLADRVADYDEALADEVAELESRLAAAESDLEARSERVEELESALKRSKADFKNYKKRAKKRESEIRERATEDFVGRVVSVRDNLVRALDQDEDADIRPGVESTLEEFDRILDEENVTPIDPEPGETVDPTRHEVLMRVDDERPEGTVVDVYQPGYEMAGSVLREAQVTVSTGAGESDDS